MGICWPRFEGAVTHRGRALKVPRRFWPEAWWPDQRTLGLLIFGFFGVAAVSVLVYSGAWISQALEDSYIPTGVRVGSGSAFVGGVADLSAALGGLALMADLSWARVVTASSVGVAAATVLVTLVVAPFGAVAPPLASLILDVAIGVLVMRWQPRRAAGTRSVSSGNSAADGGTEAVPQSG
jgi:hypothetical protein